MQVFPPARETRWTRLIPVLVLIFTAPLTWTGARSTSRVDGAIRCLYLGDPWSFVENRLVLDWIRAEPRLGIVVVPCDLEVMMRRDAVRFTRLYLPRTFSDYNSSYDVLLPNNISPMVIEDHILNFFPTGIEDEGMGCYLVGFDFWGGTNDIGFWKGLTFYDLLPCDIDTDTYHYPEDGKIFYKILQIDPLFNLPGELNNIPMFDNRGGDILPRQGSVVHAIWSGRKTPAVVTGSYGRGTTLQLDQAWNDFPIESMLEYRYFPDLIYNQLFFVVGVDPPLDVELAHRTRELFIDTRTRKKVTLSLIEFIDTFGAKTGEIEDQVASLEDVVREAERKYLRGEHAAASSLLNSVLERYEEMDSRITAVKERALLWIYLTEWIIVASTSMICGAMVWTLMVRRRLYHEAGTSRFFSDQE